MVKSNKGISIIESLVCIVIIGIGFIAVMQLSAFSINSMDRATERNKLNYLSEMVMEDMIGDPDNVSKYGNFNKTCSSGNQNTSDLHTRMKKKWDDKLQEKNFMKVDNKDRKPKCDNYDTKKTYVNSGTNTSGRVKDQSTGQMVDFFLFCSKSNSTESSCKYNSNLEYRYMITLDRFQNMKVFRYNKNKNKWNKIDG